MNWELIIDSLPKLLEGAVTTVYLTVLSIVLGLLIAIPTAMALRSKNFLVNWPATGFVFYFRGTPLLVQLFLVYYGSGQFRDALTDMGLWQYFKNAWFCAVLTLTLNTAAYSAEIFRGALQAVPRGEIEAGKAFGMSKWMLFKRVQWPKAFRIALPAYGNEIIFLLQATSLVGAITVLDLTKQADLIRSKTFAVYEMYLSAAVLYLIMTYVLVYFFKVLEKNLNAYQIRPI
jgi:octopine/nopaline transport system permease protein/arginine/ornithine transport system permease protein